MVIQDSDDYELMPSSELDDLRREVTSLKKNSMTEGDKARILIESMDRLTISINRLITILDDAQKDIIDEYQEAKPAEKLNALLEQNQTIAKALVALSENLGSARIQNQGGVRNVLPIDDHYTPATLSGQNPGYQSMPNAVNTSTIPAMGQHMQGPGVQMPAMPGISAQNLQNPISGQGQMQGQFPSGNQPPLDFPMDDLPPLDTPPNAPKKKFLGIM